MIREEKDKKGKNWNYPWLLDFTIP